MAYMRIAVLQFIMAKNSTQKTGDFFEFALALSAVSMCACSTIRFGPLAVYGSQTLAFLLLTFSLVACLAALLFPHAALPQLSQGPLQRLMASSPALPLLLLALAFQWLGALDSYPPLAPLLLMLPVFVVLALYAFAREGADWTKLKWLNLCALLLLFMLCGGAIIVMVTPAITDVVVFQRDAVGELLAGRNPYAMTFPNVYPDDRFYGPGVSVNGVLQFGFPYPPLTLLWVIPAQALLGDFRYGHLLALAIGAGLIAALRASPTALVAALLMIFSVPAFRILHIGWMEPFSVMLLCVVVWASCRTIRSGAVWAGVLAASKQYLFFVFPLTFLLPGSPKSDNPPRARWKNAFVALATAILLTLPFFLWDVGAFTYSVALLQFVQPFRMDAFSYVVLVKLLGGPQLPFWVGFGVSGLALVFCLWRAPRTVAGFAGSVAFVQCIFFAFAKQAFANYYYFVFAALCCATAAAHAERMTAWESTDSS